MSYGVIIFTLWLFASCELTASYNILGIFLLPARSHFIFIDALMVSLAERGHTVTSYNVSKKTQDSELRRCESAGMFP